MNVDNTKNIGLNFKNDYLLNNRMFLNSNVLNWFSALVKKSDFHSYKRKSNSLCCVPYLCGEKLTKIVKDCLESFEQKYKEDDYLLLRIAFRSYSNELSYQRINCTKRLLNKWIVRNMFPFTFLRVLSHIISNGNRKLETEIISTFILFADNVTSFYKPRFISLPKTLNEMNDKTLWYFIGVCVGDGSLLDSNGTWRLQISDGTPHTEELKECKEFLEKVKSLVEIKFDFRLPSTSIHKESGNWYNLEIFDKWLVRFLNLFFDLPIGYKKGKLSTPKILNSMKDKKMLEKCFWRGMFDTDGMINRKARSVVLVSSDKMLIDECKNFLLECDISGRCQEKTDHDGNPYNQIIIDSPYIKNFAIHVGSSHPLKQRILANHLQKPLKYYIFQDLNKRNITPEGKFKLELLNKKDKRIVLPAYPSAELLKIATCVSIIDWERKRIFIKTQNIHLMNFNLDEALSHFEKIFGLKPKFLSSRNMWYVNSQLLNEFFRKFFIYDLPWKALTKKETRRLVKEWNGVYGN